MAYQHNIIERINRADPDMLGVQLGQACVAKEVSVKEVASQFRKSRQAVYNWFFGVHDVEDTLRIKVQQYISQL